MLLRLILLPCNYLPIGLKPNTKIILQQGLLA